MKITGTFEVKLSPLDSKLPKDAASQFGRLYIEKSYSGELDAQSTGEMLSIRTPVQGSAGYVALEHVNGTLSGKSGSFTLMHYGVMNDGTNQLRLEVVPNSGTDGLEGLSGTMNIRIESGQHFYDFEFEF